MTNQSLESLWIKMNTSQECGDFKTVAILETVIPSKCLGDMSWQLVRAFKWGTVWAFPAGAF